MDYVALFLVLVGSIGLVLSLRPAYAICAYSQFSNKGWLTLLLLIGLFIVSYLSYLSLLFSSTSEIDFIQLVVAGIFFAGGGFVYLVTNLSKQTIMDIDVLLQQKHHQANHDLLTTLANRQHFYRHMDQMLALKSEGFYCLMLDINNFKMINDTFGHPEGDRILTVIAQRILQVVPENSLTARIGGDEFAIIIPDTANLNISDVAKDIETALLIDIPCAGHLIVIAASIGISQYPEDGQDSKTLIKYADIAMYHAKKNEMPHQYYQSHLPTTTLPESVLDVEKS
ncbi:GGDEF domain-containing protein [Shewanella sp. 6_MG-2023]|uniref:GGDEF domain-containing protein n=1 Tax=Shewanella sp. 6_MG-2023 TaxID=3062660 RepID=UPI0026E3606B|nr:GGDEF domain-containing protein [Shewanella sp. 6_MG-2023]MDO6619834.1 GGDEF domain-containing protein [Shewanella sp. 6_MG-2023]